MTAIRPRIERARNRVFRWETQYWYGAAGEAESLAAWEASGRQDIELDTMDAWCDLIRSTVDRGVSVRRVRALCDPLTTYLCWEQALADRYNIPAGEDIRVLDVDAPGRDQLPGDDFWVVDDLAFVVAYDADHHMTGLSEVDPNDVDTYVRHMVNAWTHSRRWDEQIAARDGHADPPGGART